MKKVLGFLLTIILFIITATSAHAAIPSILNVTSDKPGTAKYQKIEWMFDLNKGYANPYYNYDPSDTTKANPSTMTWVGADGVSVDLHLISPSGKSITVPAFWMEDYLRVRGEGSLDVEVLGKKDNGRWHIRYSPSEVGTYQYYITAQDKDGVGRYPANGTQTFNSADSNDKGFVRVSKKDTRFMAYDNTQSYIPIASGHQWWNNRAIRSYDYEDAFNEFGRYQINLVRIWDHQDYALGIEGAQPVWVKEGTVYGDAEGIEINSANVHSGMRAAKPASTSPWYQRLAIAEPTKPHKVTVWIKTDTVAGSASVQIRNSNNATIAQTQGVSGTTGWTQYTTTFTPNTGVVRVYLITSGSGTAYFDDIAMGVSDTSNNIVYNEISDGDFERHFSKGNPGNDPDTTPTLARPLGNYINQWAAYDLDKVVEAAQTNGVKIQLCACSGPWFTWPTNNDNLDYSAAWTLKSWERNFRYRVARWGYSPAILAWEQYNERGHIPSGTALFTWYQNYGAYESATDPYGHLRTTSQNSQAYSPGLWSSNAMDLANYHDYTDSRSSLYTSLHADEANFISRFAYCLTDITRPTGSNPNCSSLGLGDGSTWSGPAKPWVWGETGATGAPSETQGETGRRFLHNTMYAGLFSPMGTNPIEWWWFNEDATAHTAKNNEKKILSTFFSNVDYDGGNFVYIVSSGDTAPGYLGESANVSNTKARVYGMRRGDKTAAYVWVQHKDHTWVNTTSITPINTTVTLNNLLNNLYTIDIWNTYTGTVISSTQVQAANNSLTIPVNNLSDDVAIKIQSLNGSPSPTPSPTVVPPTPTPVSNVGNGDVNGDGKVDATDVAALFQNWFAALTNTTDQYKDGVINAMDFAVVAQKFSTPVTSTPTPTTVPIATPTVKPTTVPSTPTPVVATPTPTTPQSTPIPTTPPSQTSSTEWSQFGHDAQHTNYTLQSVALPWKYKWQWNGAGPDGKKQAGHMTVPLLAQPITGGGRVYMIANDTVYALDKNTGSTLWTKGSIGALNSTPIYDGEKLYVASKNNSLYKLNASTGATESSFGATSGINYAPALVGNKIFVTTTNGTLYAVDKTSMAKLWEYNGGSSAVTSPSYSASKDLVFFNTQDLTVHAVVASSGASKWKVKPSPKTYSAGVVEFDNGWPVVAEQHGIVLVRMRIEWDSIWTWNPFKTTNAGIKADLTGRPDQQVLFALNMDNGQKAFIPNVGNGGQGDGGYLPMGPQPVIRVVNGQEVAYIIWRNGQACGTGWCDGREDANMGEMVLDNNTVPGYNAGDVRFIRFTDIQTDEMMNITMSNDILFHSHWLINSAEQITDRSNGVGDSFTNPIKTVDAPFVIWRQIYCTPGVACNPQLFPGGSGNSWGPSDCQFNALTRYCNTGLYSYGDQRAYPPGFYEYHNDANLTDGKPFTIVSDGTVLVKTNDGGLIALQNGNPLAQAGSNRPLAEASSRANVLGTSTQSIIDYKDAGKYIGQKITVEGTIKSAVSHLPKAVYLGFTDPHDGALLIRIFNKDLGKFTYDPMKLKDKKIKVTGVVSLYWPEGKDPEIIVTDPSQLSW